MTPTREQTHEVDEETLAPKELRSFRLPPSLLGDLERHAREVGLRISELVVRYLGEGLRRDDHPLVVFRDGTAGRRAALVGTRLDVWQVIDTLRSSSNSVGETAEYLGISEAQVRACVRYYAFYGDEIDEWAERMNAIAEHEREAWRREQAVLA